MRLHRFYINKKIEEKEAIIIDDKSLINQWLRVFRFKVGDKLVLFYGDGFDYESEIVFLNKDSSRLKIVSKNKILNNSEIQISLFASIIKKDNFEWVVEKCTEIGVTNFQPIVSERSEKKNLNLDRLRVISKEAIEQSGRGFVPEIFEPKSLEEVLNNIDSGASIAFDSSGEDFFSKNLQLKSCNLFVGPEGGFSQKEINLFKKKNIPIFSLGCFTLRAETASIVVSSLLLLQKT
jgi:16S rRNA (uracil1498-N3)-methyltransferase